MNYKLSDEPIIPYVTRRMDEGPVLTSFGRLISVLEKLGLKSAKMILDQGPYHDWEEDNMHAYIAQACS